MDYKLLHIFGQGAWHEEVHIVGNREALEALRDTILSCIASKEARSMEAFVNDGEGYKVRDCRIERGVFDRGILAHVQL